MIAALIASVLAFTIVPTTCKLLPHLQDLKSEFPCGQKDEGPSPESRRMSPAQALNERDEESETFARARTGHPNQVTRRAGEKNWDANALDWSGRTEPL